VRTSFWIDLQKQVELRLADQEYGGKFRETVSLRVAQHPLASSAPA
jgi:hypothetical protein